MATIEERVTRAETLQQSHDERHARIEARQDEQYRRIQDKLEHLDDHLDRMEHRQTINSGRIAAVAESLKVHVGEARSRFRKPTLPESSLGLSGLAALIWALLEKFGGS